MSLICTNNGWQGRLSDFFDNVRFWYFLPDKLSLASAISGHLEISVIACLTLYSSNVLMFETRAPQERRLVLHWGSFHHEIDCF
jgi:hypothetical protein